MNSADVARIKKQLEVDGIHNVIAEHDKGDVQLGPSYFGGLLRNQR
jgi:hypothetical protein